MTRLHRARLTQGGIALFLLGVLFALTGCQSEVQTSAEYQKLPAGEGTKRMEDTLKRRASVRPGHTPPPPSYSGGSAPSGH